MISGSYDDRGTGSGNDERQITSCLIQIFSFQQQKLLIIPPKQPEYDQGLAQYLFGACDPSNSIRNL